MIRNRIWLGLGGALLLTALLACGERPEAAAKKAAVPPEPLSPEAAAIAAYEGPTVLGVPRYPDAEKADDMRARMRKAWVESGESPELFDVRLGEVLYASDDAFDLVREFYLPFVSKVFMDHEMEFEGVGSQRMFTGLMRVPDGELVKFTITRPFFRYPDQRAVDRTVIQMGRVGSRP